MKLEGLTITLRHTTAGNADYSHRCVMKPNERPESVSGCSDTCEAINELLALQD